MIKFKVGDKVKAKSTAGFRAGCKGMTVVAIEEGRVRVDPGRLYMYVSELELDETTPEPNYNDGKWHGWNGGECPVHPETVIEARWKSTIASQRGQAGYYGAGQWTWENNYSNHIIAFRVVKEHKEPREWWICKTDIGATFTLNTCPYEDTEWEEIIHVREVTE